LKRLPNIHLARSAALLFLLTLVFALGSAGTTWAHGGDDAQPARSHRPPPGTVPPRKADLSIDKRGTWTGENINFTIVVSNSGPVVAKNVIMGDTIPSTLSIGSYKTSKGSCEVIHRKLVCYLGSLAADQEVRIELRTRVSHRSTKHVTNIALVATTTEETSYSNNVDSATVKRP
jgi:uncharacterized repeat protein (TIGR01451 family)